MTTRTKKPTPQSTVDECLADLLKLKHAENVFWCQFQEAREETTKAFTRLEIAMGRAEIERLRKEQA